MVLIFLYSEKLSLLQYLLLYSEWVQHQHSQDQHLSQLELLVDSKNYKRGLANNESKELYNLEKDPNEEENLIDTNLDIQKLLWDELEKNKINL